MRREWSGSETALLLEMLRVEPLARRWIPDLARKIGRTPRAIHQRICELKRAGVIP